MGQKQSVLVVGGAGYIGSHAVKELAARGYAPVTLDSLVTGHADAVRAGELVVGDMGDVALVRRLLREHRVCAVMHFAAFVAVGESVIDPAPYYANNVSATLGLLDAMRAEGVGRLIFSSTCATYGEPEHVPIDETHPQRPLSPYGRTKWMVEQVLRDYEQAYGLRSVVFRYFNAAGAHPDGDIGERHDPETHLIPLLLEAARAGEPVRIFGDDYATHDGTCVRDYVHVVDLARAHVLGLERLLSGAGSATYNLGSQRGYTVREVIDAVERVTGRKLVREVLPRRAGDPAQLVGAARKVRDELGWVLEFDSIDRIVETAWRWHQRAGEANDAVRRTA